MNNIFESLKAFGTPQAFMDSVMKNSQIMKNPIAKNTFDMMKRGDSKGLEETARNLLKEQGLDPDEVYNQVKSQFGR